jgi:topoisomerase IA-like protein
MKIKYVDHRRISIPYLFYHKGGVSLPSGDNIIKVTDGEARHLLKVKNGQRNSFEEVKETSRKSKEEVIEDVSREWDAVSGV